MENKWERNRVPLVEIKLDCTLTEKQQNYISHVSDMELPCSKLNNSNLIKDRNIILQFSKGTLTFFNTNELVSTFTLKISNYIKYKFYISFINHLHCI